MDKITLIVALCLCFSIAKAEKFVAGNIKWDSKNSLTEDEIVSKYELGEERKGGAFSTYINGTLKSTKEKVGIKLEDPESEECYLPLEVQVYRDLQQRATNLLDKGFANLYDYGMIKNKRALIISQFGDDLIDYIIAEQRQFYEWKELQFIATSAIDDVRFLHDTGYIHQDIKPDNFMYGLGDPKDVKQAKNCRMSLKNRIYLMDLGGATRYRDANGTCYKQKEALPFTITTEPYSSRTYKQNLTQSRRDDMETLGNALLTCGGVTLPWDCDDLTDDEITVEQDRLCDKLEVVPICRESEIVDKRVQAAFSTYFFLLKKLFTAKDGFCQEPPYDAFKKCFSDDPQTYYFNVTGKEFEGKTAVNLMRRPAENFSTNIESIQNESDEDGSKASDHESRHKKAKEDHSKAPSGSEPKQKGSKDSPKGSTDNEAKQKGSKAKSDKESKQKGPKATSDKDAKAKESSKDRPKGVPKNESIQKGSKENRSKVSVPQKKQKK